MTDTPPDTTPDGGGQPNTPDSSDARRRTLILLLYSHLSGEQLGSQECEHVPVARTRSRASGRVGGQGLVAPISNGRGVGSGGRRGGGGAAAAPSAHFIPRHSVWTSKAAARTAIDGRERPTGICRLPAI